MFQYSFNLIRGWDLPFDAYSAIDTHSTIGTDIHMQIYQPRCRIPFREKKGISESADLFSILSENVPLNSLSVRNKISFFFFVFQNSSFILVFLIWISKSFLFKLIF